MFALLAVLTVAFCNLALGLIVLLKNRGNFTHTSFGVFAFIMAVWLTCNYFSNIVILDHQLLLWLNRVTFFLSGMGLYFLLLFSLEFTRFKYKYFRPFAISFGLTTLAISLISMSRLVIADIVPKPKAVTITFGPLIWLFTPFIVGLFLAIIAILAGSIPRLRGSARARTRIMTVSLFVSLATTVGTNLILPVAYGNYDFVLIGMLSTIIIVGGFSYAIVRHRLFDIRTIVARSIAYLMLLFTLGGLYAFITFRIGGMLFSYTKVSASQQAFNIITALILALTFQPLKRLFEIITDKIFYRNQYDPEKLMNDISRIMASEIELMELTRKVRGMLIQQMRLEHVDIIVLDGDKVFLETGHYMVSELEDLARDLGTLRGKVLVTDEEPEGRRKEILQGYGISVLAALRTREDKIGYLLFGEKLNGDIYTNVDLRLITILADQFAVAIQNAKSYVQIQRFNRTLQAKVEEATKQLRDANASLQQLDKVKDEFLSMASHQLRTPMTVIDGYLANIRAGVYGPFNERQSEALKFAQNRVQLTAGLVADLLNLSRMEAGRFFIDATPVDLAKVVGEEIDQLKIKAGQQHVELHYSAPTHPVPTLSLDEQKTRQVIMNLIDNAINYSPKGTVKVSLEVVGNQVMFKVIDNGIGVPEAEQAKLFNKFYRASNAKDERADGTGIGLYLVKRVVEQQGGTLIFESKQGQGSTFGFRIPINTTIEGIRRVSPVKTVQPPTPYKDALTLSQK